MSTRTTLLLLVLIVFVGGYLWWEQRAAPPAAPPGMVRGAATVVPTAPLRRFFEFQPEQVVRVQLRRDGINRTATISDAGWPSPAIGEFLRVLTEVGVIMEVSADPHHAAEYGLNPPRSEAVLYLANDPSPLVLRLGDRNPPATGVYVQAGASGPIGLAGALVDWEFEKAFRGLTPTATSSGRDSRP